MALLIEVTELKDLSKGEYFKISPSSQKVWVKEDYQRDIKKYSCSNALDMNNERFFKPSQVVYLNFEF